MQGQVDKLNIVYNLIFRKVLWLNDKGKKANG